MSNPTPTSQDNEIEQELDDLLEEAYLGLYAQDPDTRAFIPMDDRHLVLHNDLKSTLLKLIKKRTLESQIKALEAIVDDRPLTTMDVILNLYVQRIEARLSTLHKELKELS